MEIIQNSIQKLKKAGYQVQQKEQNRIQFQVMVCGRFAFDGLFLYDESDSEYPPDVILNGLSCKWKEIQALYEYKNSSSDLLRAVNQMKRIFVKKQLLEMKQLGIHQLDFEINCIPDSTDCFLERREDLIVCWFEMPFDTNENGAIGKVLFEFQVSQTLDFISNVIPTIHWPFDPPFEFKTPKFDREATMIEYMSRMQMSINKKLRRSIHNNLQRELFVTQMISQFKNFVLEYDEIDHLYLSLYIFMSAPSEDQTRNTEDILGAAVVNDPNQFPETAPMIILSSPLYYESADSCAPASRILQFSYDVGMSVEQTVSMLKSEILNQIVLFQSFLLQEATRI